LGGGLRRSPYGLFHRFERKGYTLTRNGRFSLSQHGQPRMTFN
jgi:hypothetical protein